MATAEFDFERHFKNIYKEAKKLATYQTVDDKLKKVRTKKMLSEFLTVSDYEKRLRYMMSNFCNKEHAILLSMRNKLGTVIGEEALRETYTKLVDFNKTLAQKKEMSKKDTTPVIPEDVADSVEYGTISMTERAVGEHVDYQFSQMARCFGVKKLEEEEDYKKQCRNIARLLSDDDDDDELEEYHQNYDEILQTAANLILKVHSDQNITPKHAFKGLNGKKEPVTIPGITKKSPPTLGASMIKSGLAEQTGITMDDKFGEISMINQMRAQTPRGTSSGTMEQGSVMRPPLTARGVPSAVLPPRTTSNANLRRASSSASLTRAASSGSVVNTPRGSASSGSLTARSIQQQSGASASRVRLVVKDQTSGGKKTPRTQSKRQLLPPRVPNATTPNQVHTQTTTQLQNQQPQGSATRGSPVADESSGGSSNGMSTSTSPTSGVGPSAGSEKF